MSFILRYTDFSNAEGCPSREVFKAEYGEEYEVVDKRSCVELFQTVTGDRHSSDWNIAQVYGYDEENVYPNWNRIEGFVGRELTPKEEEEVRASITMSYYEVYNYKSSEVKLQKECDKISTEIINNINESIEKFLSKDWGIFNQVKDRDVWDSANYKLNVMRAVNKIGLSSLPKERFAVEQVMRTNACRKAAAWFGCYVWYIREIGD